MSLFGGQTQQPQQSGGLFGGFGSSTTGNQQQQQQQQSGGGLFGSTQNNQQSGGGLFGSTQNQQSGGGLFGSTQNKPSGGLFGNTQTSQPQQSGGLFGSTPQNQSQPQTGGLFGSTAQQKPQGGLFGGFGQQQQQQQQPQQQPQQQTGGLFGGLGSNTQQQQQPQQQPSLFGGSLMAGQQQQQQPQQQPQLGQSTQQQNLGSSLWSPGRATTGVHRTVPMQMMIVKDKWEPVSRTSPFRTYLYNNVGEENAPFFQPGADDDESKWEEALRQRPNAGSVPVLVKGFWELGKRAQRQKDFLTIMQTRLHEINNCLTDLLSRHDLKISVKIADCRRKHIVLSQRCLSLAAKTQVLRNRGYAMDDAEEELKKKLTQLERAVFDPSLNGRAEEIWARMLAIRERSKLLQLEIEKAGPAAAEEADDGIDETVVKTAKKILEDYASQIQHLHKELEAVKKDFEEAENPNGN
ncbi:Nucleoporin nup57 [Paecilomyces lecythidis]|uniref:Nucleoporin nup57 n=1 Tax=Paecilomyces lecythidis TaxID=3004212 RepID=A0ABR3XGM8_9EURO